VYLMSGEGVEVEVDRGGSREAVAEVLPRLGGGVVAVGLGSITSTWYDVLYC